MKEVGDLIKMKANEYNQQNGYLQDSTWFIPREIIIDYNSDLMTCIQSKENLTELEKIYLLDLSNILSDFTTHSKFIEDIKILEDRIIAENSDLKLVEISLFACAIARYSSEYWNTNTETWETNLLGILNDPPSPDIDNHCDFGEFLGTDIAGGVMGFIGGGGLPGAGSGAIIGSVSYAVYCTYPLCGLT
jgi:hypothetical protein